MRYKTVGTVLYSHFYIFKIAATFVAQGIKRTVTEHTVKILVIFYFMTWEISAISIFIVTKTVLFHNITYLNKLNFLYFMALHFTIYKINIYYFSSRPYLTLTLSSFSIIGSDNSHRKIPVDAACTASAGTPVIYAAIIISRFTFG